jgi:hypothetical protein
MFSSAVHGAGAQKRFPRHDARNRLRQQGKWIAPFPVSPSGGKPGRAGSPHAATRAAPANRAGTPRAAAPPTRGLRPLVYPPRCWRRRQQPSASIQPRRANTGAARDSALPVRSRQGITMACPDRASLAGFGVTMTGRFWGDHRGRRLSGCARLCSCCGEIASRPTDTDDEGGSEIFRDADVQLRIAREKLKNS